MKKAPLYSSSRRSPSRQPAPPSDGAPARDNPFIGTPGALPEIWALGLRSPEGMAIDPATALIWA